MIGPCDITVPVHVAVGGERLPADGTLVRPLAAVDQHVSVQRRGRAQALAADAAGVVRCAGVGIVLRTGESPGGLNARRPLRFRAAIFV